MGWLGPLRARTGQGAWAGSGGRSRVWSWAVSVCISICMHVSTYVVLSRYPRMCSLYPCLCMHVSTVRAHVYPRGHTCVHVSRLRCLCREHGLSSVNRLHNHHPVGSRLSGTKGCAPLHGVAARLDRAGLMWKPRVAHRGETYARTCLVSPGGWSSALATGSLADVWSQRA